jgi:hypothetical protein
MILITLAAAALLAFAPAAGAAGGVPFSGTAVGRDTSMSLESDGIHLTSVIQGTGTLVGRFTQTLDYTLSSDLVHFAGTATITAADGSTILLVDAGVEPGFASQVFPTPFDATFTVVGGTGRFAGATGGGTVSGIDFGQGAFAFTFSGGVTP